MSAGLINTESSDRGMIHCSVLLIVSHTSKSAIVYVRIRCHYHYYRYI